MVEETLLSIGAFAARARLSPKALRLYDRLGLLVPAHVDPVNGYRSYAESQLETARLASLLRRLDMPLAQVTEVIRAPAAEAAGLVAAYWDEVERRTAGQRELARHLRHRLSGDRGELDMAKIVERDVAPQLVLTELRHVSPEEVSVWIPQATDRLVKAAEAHGGPAGAPYIVYHGEVTEDSNGPAEVCVPIALDREPPTGLPHRFEPAHREAYLRIRKSQVVYPQILTAYETVAQWVGEQPGLKISGPSREVYFGDWDAAGPDDEVYDIAFPVQRA